VRDAIQYYYSQSSETGRRMSVMRVRVRINSKNYRANHRHRDRLGTAPRIPNDGQFWNVLWDGMKKVQQFHKDFIEVVETHDQ
jgi:hypothetical protein